MPNVRREDLEMKIPALMHLSRLGYGYLSREQVRRRDRETNIFPEALRAATEKINGRRLSDGEFGQLTETLRMQLDAEDLGKAFYGTIRNGWNGIRLIDFDRPENNLFQSAAELPCGNGEGSFRPDITLFVNGLPLAMIEVKTGDRNGGLQAEYDRMLKRSQGKEARRYLQAAQVWAFSDDRAEEQDALLPTEGAFYATVAAGGFPVYGVPGLLTPGGIRLRARNAEEERRILEDNGIMERPKSEALRKSVAPNKYTHRMLTVLFFPERFLFLLRYGIQYVRETETAGKEYLTRRILTLRQMSVLRSLRGKAARGFLNWSAAPCGAAGEQAMNASLVALLRDLAPMALLHWVSADETEQRRDRKMLEACGVACVSRDEAPDGRLILTPADEAPDGRLTLLRADEESDKRQPESGTRGGAGRKVFILPSPVFRYGARRSFHAKLRRAEPDAILVTRITERETERGFSAVVMRMEVKPEKEKQYE